MTGTSAALSEAVLFVGRNRSGEWIVRDRSGRHGGMFVSRTAALGYVRIITGDRHPAVVMVRGNLELDGRL